ncbi:MAG: nucleotidyltransferase, partial [Bacteroidetes bacterium]|nr:nucleotidyltransferase [Bacteroidota bacterium]
MITKEQKRLLLENMTVQLELPESAYEKAKDRYGDIGEWLGRSESLCKDNDPHISPQGSFRLGTAIHPLDENEAYDLDLACNLRKGISRSSHTQESLKKLVGHEIETYRVARGIKAPMEEKHRCWRLEYQDDFSFHMDIVPCTPEDETRQKIIFESMRKSGESESISESASRFTVSITDDRHPGYKRICEDWNISNPEGYAKWFKTRMNQSRQMILGKAQVDDIPLFKRKTPLQQSIQLLKRHRDQMFKEYTDVKPISIIITTLAARAYRGESDIESALDNILRQMGIFVNSGSSVVSNPVNPEENFADRWQ